MKRKPHLAKKLLRAILNCKYKDKKKILDFSPKKWLSTKYQKSTWPQISLHC